MLKFWRISWFYFSSLIACSIWRIHVSQRAWRNWDTFGRILCQCRRHHIFDQLDLLCFFIPNRWSSLKNLRCFGKLRFEISCWCCRFLRNWNLFLTYFLVRKCRDIFFTAIISISKNWIYFFIRFYLFNQRSKRSSPCRSDRIFC